MEDQSRVEVPADYDLAACAARTTAGRPGPGLANPLERRNDIHGRSEMIDPCARFEDAIQVDDFRVAMMEDNRKFRRFDGLDDPLDEGRGEPAQPVRR